MLLFILKCTQYTIPISENLSGHIWVHFRQHRTDHARSSSKTNNLKVLTFAIECIKYVPLEVIFLFCTDERQSAARLPHAQEPGERRVRHTSPSANLSTCPLQPPLLLPQDQAAQESVYCYVLAEIVKSI